ncbi:MAG TPA: hypothetical protein VEJ20_00480 [Candidatus Eremiobacteraceae bacterium]|nr:hypothetical protein [Candidatus Eremiobacteraceae bacterium]
MVLILVLVLVALLLIVALAIVAASNSAGQSTTMVSEKYRVLNSAEGAENLALNDLESNPTEVNGAHFSGSINGVNYDSWVESNNLSNSGTATATDPGSGNTIVVPNNSAYIYGVAADQGGHTTYVEAIAGPAPPLALPPGAVNAGHDIQDISPMPIMQSDPLHQNNANLFANNNILVFGQPSTVQGATSAVGNDELTGAAGTYSNQSPVRFPLPVEVSLAANNAQLIAQGGSTYTGAQIAQNGTQQYNGNVYVNGNLAINSGTVTFAQGTYVYVNGNLCLSGNGQVVDANSSSSEFVVSGNVEVSGGAGYSASPGQNTLMLVLGSDAAQQPCDTNNTHAIDLTMSGTNPIGTIYAANGSVALMGGGYITGAVDAGQGVLLEGTGTGMQYDLAQADTTMNTGTLTYNSYFEH